MPKILRGDCGTENTNLAFIQPYLRHSHSDCFTGMDDCDDKDYTENRGLVVAAEKIMHNVVAATVYGKNLLMDM